MGREATKNKRRVKKAVILPRIEAAIRRECKAIIEDEPSKGKTIGG